ncbi:3-beta hydroxysteroid dehydrogenase [Deltaproteobacteria bacterium Smac51]|nr:3-beta hydroxysteroid dehydrogenase [Deltaproteobacteria bacterium Smac51]
MNTAKPRAGTPGNTGRLSCPRTWIFWPAICVRCSGPVNAIRIRFMRILITGGQGFLGRRILEMLLERGYEVRAAVRRQAPELQALGAEVSLADLGDPSALRRAAKGCEGVVHCAARSGVWGRLDDFIKANVLTTANILMAARESGAEWFIHTSSPSVTHTGLPLDGVDETAPLTDNPAHPYPYSKMLAERLVLSADQPGFHTAALRPHLIWGPGDPHFLPRLVERAGKNRLWLLQSEALVDGVYIDNAALAHILAVEKMRSAAPIGGRAYFIAQGEPLTASELISKILHAVCPQRTLAVRGHIPAWLGQAAGVVLENVWKGLALSGEPPITSFVAEELALPHWFRLDRARRELGYVPPITLAEGLQRLSDHCRERGGL